MTDPSTTPDPPAPMPDPPTQSGPTPAAATGPHRPTGAVNLGPVQYKGQPLDSERGPGLGCFRFQLVILVVLILATPLSVGRLPEAVTVVLLVATIGLLLVSGQTIIFLLRLVSADRRGRRQPLAARSPTVGQLEDAAAGPMDGSDGPGTSGLPEPSPDGAADSGSSPSPDSPGSGPVRQ